MLSPKRADKCKEKGTDLVNEFDLLQNYLGAIVGRENVFALRTCKGQGHRSAVLIGHGLQNVWARCDRSWREHDRCGHVERAASHSELDMRRERC